MTAREFMPAQPTRCSPLVVNQGQALSPQVESMVRMLYNPPYCAVRRLSIQSVATATDTPVDFLAGASVEADTHGMFATASPDRLTIKVPGVYHFEANVAIAANATGIRVVWLRVNADNTLRHVYMQFAGTSVLVQYFVLSCDVALAANDYIQVMVHQNSGVALDLPTYSNMVPRLTARWVRP